MEVRVLSRAPHWTISSAARALHLHCRGRRSKSCIVHIAAVAQVVERSSEKAEGAGARPARGTKMRNVINFQRKFKRFSNVKFQRNLYVAGVV